MNTTAAATQAGVTVATIRTWCRYGAVQAAKVAGRWVINAASLARRIAIGSQRPRRVVTDEPPLHQRPGAARYERHNGAWTVRVTGDVLDSLKAAIQTGGERAVTVTKKDGTTKQQRITGRAWQTGKSTSRAACIYLLELPSDEQQGSSTGSSQGREAHGKEICRQCRRRTPEWDLDWELDEDGVGGMVCSRCASLDSWRRSYDR